MAVTPIVAIVGRPNVGKSTLFNRLVGYRSAVTASESGTTRDAVSGSVTWGRHNFLLTDTAGFDSVSGEIEDQAQEQIKATIAGANLVVVTVDGTAAWTNQDRAIAKLALKSRKPVILAVNKSDVKSDSNNFDKLGIKQ